MCGICGVIDLDGHPVPPAVLGRMMESLAHRGPDGRGTFFHADGGGHAVALGHLRLAIIDLSPSGTQPMTNEDGTLWITFNGEIYNFRELRAELRAAGHPFHSDSDTEVILHLYEEMGDRCVERLDGMFAFALWDARRGRALLARDRAGKKPLYVHRDRRRLVFASEIKALLGHPDVPDDVDEAVIPQYLSFGYAVPPATFYRSIEEVLPGHVMTVSATGDVTTRPYWDLRFPDADRVTAIREAAAADRVRELLTRAVEKRLISDVPLGAFLSGGLDSTIVVGLMSRLSAEPVRTFSIGFAGDPAFDETRYARIASERFGTRHTEFVVEPRAVDLVDTLTHHHDGPFGDSSAIPTFLLSRLTRQHVTVALSGDGGDEVFAGYLRFKAALIGERMPAALTRLGAWAVGALPESLQHHSRLRLAQRFFGAAGESLYERVARWTAFFSDDLETVLDPDLRRRLPPIDRLANVRPHLARIASWSPLSRLLYLNAKTYLPNDLLVKTDRCSMANSLEVRSPFLDHALMEYVAGLPDDLKLRRGSAKYVLRRAFEDLVPDAIAARGKRGFGVPLGTWFRGELADYLGDVLGADARCYEWLDGGVVRRLLAEHRRGERDHGQRLWSVLTLETWLRRPRREPAWAA
jgi:asparagine synthase (glutamine-hydrolysing)